MLSKVIFKFFFPEPPKCTKIDQKVLKLNIAGIAMKFFIEQSEMDKFWKTACQNVVAVATSKLMNKDLVHQIVSR